MGRVAILGETPRVDGWALAGAIVVPVTTTEDTRRAWDLLPDDVEVVIVTPEAAARLGDRLLEKLAVVLP